MKDTLLTRYREATVPTVGISAPGPKQPTFNSSTATRSTIAVIENAIELKSLIAQSSVTEFTLRSNKGKVGGIRIPYSRTSSDLRALLIR